MNPGTNENDSSSKPMISICIPVYNAQAYMESCLLSLARQRFQDFDVIIVDDGSDKPLVVNANLLNYVGEKRVHIERTDNRGAYAARQHAALLARGDYIFFVDADDELYDIDALAKLAAAIKAHGPDVVLFNAAGKSGERLVDYVSYGWYGELNPVEFLREMVMHHRLNSLWCMVFRRELLIADAIMPRFCYAEDRLQKFEIIRRARSMWVINEPLYIYKEVPTSTTHARYKPEYYIQACLVELRISEHFDMLGIDWSAWAESFMRITCGHLLSLVRSADMARRERLVTYELFRKQLACEMALVHLDWHRADTTLRLWAGPFKKRYFGVLDSVLAVRNFIGK